jgi:hypothetical protein
MWGRQSASEGVMKGSEAMSGRGKGKGGGMGLS